MNYPSSSLPQVFLDLLSSNLYQLELLIPIGLIILDVITGVMSAFRQGTFELKKLKDSLGGNFLHFTVVAVLIVLTWATRGSSVAIELTTSVGSAVMVASLLHSIYQNLREVLSPPEIAAIDQLGSLVGLPDPFATSTPSSATPVTPPQQPVVVAAQPPQSQQFASASFSSSTSPSSSSYSVPAPIPYNQWQQVPSSPTALQQLAGSQSPAYPSPPQQQQQQYPGQQ